jgi:type I restriction enzyme S subunit
MESDHLHPVFLQMPDDWRIVRIGDLFTIQQGKQVSEKNRNGDRQRPFLRTKNVYWGRLDLTELDKMHFSEEDERRLRLLPCDLLTCEGGWVGRTAMWNGEAADCLYQNHLHRLRPISSDTDPQFALYWLWYAFEIGEVYFGRQNVTTIPNLSKSRLGELPIPAPNRSEQRQVATVLSALQRAIERQERLIALTSELKKALMHKLFTEGTRGEPLKQTEIGPVPESWDLMELKSCCTVQSGYAFKSDDYVARSNGVAIIKIGDIQDGEALISDKTSYVPQEFWTDQSLAQFRLARGALLIALTGATTGKTGQFDSDERAFLNQRVGRFLPDERRLVSAFLRFLVLQPYFQRNIKANILVAAQGNISPKSIENFIVALPKLEEQVTIANTLLCVDRRISTARARQHRLGELFRTLLHQLMTAQLRVYNLDLSALEETLQESVGAP